MPSGEKTSTCITWQGRSSSTDTSGVLKSVSISLKPIRKKQRARESSIVVQLSYGVEAHAGLKGKEAVFQEAGDDQVHLVFPKASPL